MNLLEHFITALQMLISPTHNLISSSAKPLSGHRFRSSTELLPAEGACSAGDWCWKALCECCFRSLFVAWSRLKDVPSRQRRSWWRTPTAARSLSASPWCPCRSQCHQASTCSTSPKIDKSKCFMTTSTYNVCKLPCIAIYAKLSFPVWTHTKWSECLQVSRPWFFPPYIVTYHYLALATWYSSIWRISFKSKWDSLHITFNPASRICCKWESYVSTGSSFSHYCFFIHTSIMWKWV